MYPVQSTTIEAGIAVAEPLGDRGTWTEGELPPWLS